MFDCIPGFEDKMVEVIWDVIDVSLKVKDIVGNNVIKIMDQIVQVSHVVGQDSLIGGTTW